MKPPLRTKSVGTKVSEEEFAALESLARARKLTLSEWVRAELLEPRGSISGLNGVTGYLRGQALQGIFNAATESGAISSIAAEGGQIAVQGGLTAGEFASGVGIAKFIFDAATFGAGLVSCAAK